MIKCLEAVAIACRVACFRCCKLKGCRVFKLTWTSLLVAVFFLALYLTLPLIAGWGPSVPVLAGEKPAIIVGEGSWARYRCGISNNLELLPLLINHVNVLGELERFLESKVGVSLGEIEEEKVFARAKNVIEALSALELNIGCILWWKVLGFNGSHYSVKVGLDLSVVNSTSGEAIYNMSRSIERVLNVGPDRVILVNGRPRGVWPFFLYPWEVYEGSSVTVSQGLAFPPRIVEVIGAATSNLQNVKDAGLNYPGELKSSLRNLGIREDRVLSFWRGAILVSRDLPQDVRDSYLRKFYRYEPLNMSLEEYLEEMSKYHVKNKVRVVSKPPILLLSVNAAYDSVTGVMLYYQSLSYPLDPFYSILNTTRYMASMLLAFPSTAYIVELRVAPSTGESEKPVNVGGHSSPPTPPTVSSGEGVDLGGGVDSKGPLLGSELYLLVALAVSTIIILAFIFRAWRSGH